jgi:aminoglycoside phosphotransferase (APT) family kinase protein
MAAIPELGEVSAGLRGWLAGQGHGAVSDAAPPERLTGGADFLTYAMRFAGPDLPAEWSVPLVARVPARAERFTGLQRESAVQSWVASRGYPAPRVLAVVPPREASPLPMQVMTRVPGVPLLSAAPRPWRLPELLTRMGTAHAERHRIGVPTADCTPSLLDNSLRLPTRLAESGDAVDSSLRKIELVRARLEAAEQVMCHGDFHPLNVLVVPGQPVLSVIDWTTAGVGDRHGDIAGTLLWFEIVTIAAPRRQDRVLARALRGTLTRAYLTGYRRVIPVVDFERVRLWRPVSLLQIWSAALASQRGFFGGEPRLPARLATWAAREFTRAAASPPG